MTDTTPGDIPADWGNCPKCGAMRFYPSGRCMQGCDGFVKQSPKSETQTTKRLAEGMSVKVGGRHPWAGERGTLVAFEEYGLGWHGWRVLLDNGTECYASVVQLQRTK